MSTKRGLALINKPDRYSHTPLHVACEKGYTTVVKVLPQIVLNVYFFQVPSRQRRNERCKGRQ